MNKDSKRLTDALFRVRQMALEAADELIGDRICWHGREAVAAALLEIGMSNLVDNLHDDPSFYEEDVEDTLAEPTRVGLRHP